MQVIYGMTRVYLTLCRYRKKSNFMQITSKYHFEEKKKMDMDYLMLGVYRVNENRMKCDGVKWKRGGNLKKSIYKFLRKCAERLKDFFLCS